MQKLKHQTFIIDVKSWLDTLKWYFIQETSFSRIILGETHVFMSKELIF
jgi:hypothetical protein